MNYNEQFAEGVAIIAKYMEGKDDWAVQASHDTIWWGNDEWVTDESDRKRLEELGWVTDEEAWVWMT